jgi:hypothetical protein
MFWSCDDGEIIQHALGIASDYVANYCFPKSWPEDREPRARIVGDCCNRGAVSGLTST